MKKRILAMLLAVVLMFTLVACGGKKEEAPAEEPAETQEADVAEEPQEEPTEEVEKGEPQEIILATTTSTEDSGLLDYILPMFTEETNVSVSVVSVGTGQAIRMGEDGEADALLVHDTPSEEEFVEAGHSDELGRRDVMYNDFILVGPKEDKDGVKAEFGSDIEGALAKLAADNLVFVSRGDDSGTHKTEMRLWENADIDTTGDWYQSVGKGMGDTLIMASEQQAYTLTDRATYLTMKDDLDLDIITEGDDKLYNQYGVLVVNPEKNENINHDGAVIFANWIVSENGQKAIGEFVEANTGEPLFTPNAK